jgi:hypothetical protein
MSPQGQLGRVDRMCMTFLETDIQAALTSLRLAAAESAIGNVARASELIDRAVLEYKSVRKRIDELPVEMDLARAELREQAQRLSEAILATERQVHVLAG